LYTRRYKQAYFVRCSPECEKFAAEHMGNFVKLAAAQMEGGAGRGGGRVHVESS
jgi:hypothetical protein